jgi:hypothetical protein
MHGVAAAGCGTPPRNGVEMVVGLSPGEHAAAVVPDVGDFSRHIALSCRCTMTFRVNRWRALRRGYTRGFAIKPRERAIRAGCTNLDQADPARG